MLEALPNLLAMCEGMAGAERTRWTLIPPLAFLAWGLISWTCIWRSTDVEERPSLLGLLAISAVVGGLIFLIPEGTSGDGSYLLRFWFSVPVTAVIGAAWAELSPQPIAFWRGIAVALAGNVMVPGGLVLLLFWVLALSGGCLG